MTDKYRIEYVIQRRKPEEDDFTEIGFGSSGSWGSLNACTHMLNSDVSNQNWETESHHPDPSSIDPTGCYPPVSPDAEERLTSCPECGDDTEGAAGAESCGCGWVAP